MAGPALRMVRRLSLSARPAAALLKGRPKEPPPFTPRVAGRAPVEAELVEGKLTWWCACGYSARQPFCDGKHKFKPVRGQAMPKPFRPKLEDLARPLCMCKRTGSPPFCDGSHQDLADVEEAEEAERAAAAAESMTDAGDRRLSIAARVAQLRKRPMEPFSPRVAGRAPTVAELAEGQLTWWCACGYSTKQPFCDGKHKFKPVRNAVKPKPFRPKREDLARPLCMCKRTGSAPFCDGSHRNLVVDEQVARESAGDGGDRPLRRFSLAARLAQLRRRGWEPFAPRVADTGPVVAALVEGKLTWWCACGHSAQQPFCDGKHKFKPVRSQVMPKPFRPKREDLERPLCMCKRTGSPPFCDGSHNSLSVAQLESTIHRGAESK